MSLKTRVKIWWAAREVDRLLCRVSNAIRSFYCKLRSRDSEVNQE